MKKTRKKKKKKEKKKRRKTKKEKKTEEKKSKNNDKKKKTDIQKEKKTDILKDHRGIIFASLYTIIKKQNGSYLFIGAKSMPCHQSKKVVFLPYLSFGTKKSFLRETL